MNYIIAPKHKIIFPLIPCEKAWIAPSLIYRKYIYITILSHVRHYKQYNSYSNMSDWLNKVVFIQ